MDSAFAQFALQPAPTTAMNTPANGKKVTAMPETDIATIPYYLFEAIIVLFLILMGIGTISSLSEFLRELKSLNSEIRRSCGTKRKYLLRRRRRLWLSLLPFVKY